MIRKWAYRVGVTYPTGDSVEQTYRSHAAALAVIVVLLDHQGGSCPLVTVQRVVSLTK